MEYLRGITNAVRQYVPSTEQVTAIIPRFRDADGEPRYGLIALSAGLAAGASYFVLRSSFSNRERYPYHLMNQRQSNQLAQPPSTTTTIATTAPATTPAPAPAATNGPASPTPPTPPPQPHPPLTTAAATTAANTTTLTTGLQSSPIGPLLLFLVTIVTLVMSVSSTLQNENISNLNSLYVWNWVHEFPLFLPLFYTALGLTLHQHLSVQQPVEHAATTAPYVVVDASHAHALVKTTKPTPPMPSFSYPQTTVVAASKSNDDDDDDDDDENAYRGERKTSRGETKESSSSFPGSPSSSSRSPSRLRRSTMAVIPSEDLADETKLFEALDQAWEESESGVLDKKQVLNQVINVLNQKPNCIGLLWRASRGESNIAAWDPNIAEESKRNHVKHGLQYAEKALAECKANAPTVSNIDHAACHKFLAICLGQKTQFLSNPKDQLNLASDIASHIAKGIALNPNDPMLHYMQGQWQYNIADISYSIRYAASWVTGTLLEATFEDALKNFEKATSVGNSFYCDNEFMTARTMLKLNNGNSNDRICELLTTGIAMTPANPSSKVLQEKAQKLLANLTK